MRTVRSNGREYRYLRPPKHLANRFPEAVRLPDDPVAAGARARQLVESAPPIWEPDPESFSDRYKDRVWAWKAAELVRSSAVRARRKGRAHEITASDLLEMMRRQGFRCAVTGLQFRFMAARHYWRHPFAPSLDRISSAGGYTRGNVRLVLAAVNVAMGEWGEDLFLRVARAAVARNPR